MPITRQNLDEVVEADLAELVTASAAEGIALEFKEQSYGASDADKRELLKDVSAFANAYGGHLILGVKEDRGVAAGLPGLSVADIDAEALRLGQIIRAGIEPPILGCALRVVRLRSATSAIVIRVPRSWRPPHRISAQGTNRFWIRNSSGCHEASLDELRSLFGQSAGAIDGARRFRNERLHLVQTSQAARPLVGGGRLLFHIVPQSALLSSETLDPSEIYKLHGAFAPLGSMGMSPRFNFEGVINERGGEQNHGYTQIFRNGSVEATKASILRRSDRGLGIPGRGLEETFFERYDQYLAGLKNLGVQPPLVLMLTLEGVRGARYFVSNDPFEDDPVEIDRDVLHLTECVLTEYGAPETTHAVIRPAFDALWNAAGYAGARFFSKTGVWDGKGVRAR